MLFGGLTLQQIDLRYVTSKAEFIFEVLKAAGEITCVNDEFGFASLLPPCHPRHVTWKISCAAPHAACGLCGQVSNLATPPECVPA